MRVEEKAEKAKQAVAQQAAQKKQKEKPYSKVYCGSEEGDLVYADVGHEKGDDNKGSPRHYHLTYC